jgi:serine/threonine protein kinase
VSNNIRLSETDRDLPKHVKNGFTRYRDFKPLTQGGEAMLQTCYDENLGRTVVMKTLLPQLQNLEVYRKRFLREARVTAQIPHPATVPVYEISRDREGNAYFTMKRLGGRDLCDILHIGQCLSYAHNLGVVHRDLKPANIMIGDYGEVTLLDWGLAKVWNMEDNEEIEQLLRSGQQQMSGRLTGRGDVQGTPFYMSPEQARETSDVDGRTDIYNMGIILYEILTNQSFMSGRNFKEIKRKILDGPLRTPADVLPRNAVPPELNAICRKALLKDPQDRYSSMDQLTDDLLAYLLGKPVSVYRMPALFRLLRTSSRKSFNISSAFWLLFGAIVYILTQQIWLAWSR